MLKPIAESYINWQIKMKVFLLIKKLLLLTFAIILFSENVASQAFDFNSFFPNQAISFGMPDSNNMIYDEVKDPIEMDNLLDSILPFNTNEFYGAFPGINTDDTISFLPGLHELLPAFDSQANEIKGKFTLNNKTDYWYSYYKKSIQDTSTAIVIFPGFGANESFHIANNDPDDYHDFDCLVKEKALSYGDIYIIVKPNEDFRTIWKSVPNSFVYGKLDYNVMTPYTDYIGKDWAANLYIELLAQLKYLKSKYKKVIAIGLSNAGFPVLTCGLEAGIDGINCASGLSVTSYNGFPVPNNENPYFSGLFDYYSLDSIKNRIINSESKILFTYGSDDCCTNAYEYNTHSLENYLNTPNNLCNVEFFYGFSGHTFSCQGLDSFFRKVNGSPKLEILPISISCTYDSLPFTISITGQSPFNFDLYKDDVFYKHYVSNDNLFSTSVNVSGNYQVVNLTDSNNIPLCKSEKFVYVKPILPGILKVKNISNDCRQSLDTIEITMTGIAPFQILSDIDGYVNFIPSTNPCNIIAPNGTYNIISIKDSSGCTNTINLPVKIGSDYFLNENPTLRIENSYLIATETPYKYDWFKDGTIIYSSGENKLITHGGGEYYAVLTDSTGCSYNTNSIILKYPTGVNVYQNPSSTDVSILIDEKFKGNWSYSIFDNIGRSVLKGQSSAAYQLVNLKRYQAGIYNIAIEYVNVYGEKIKVIKRVIRN